MYSCSDFLLRSEHNNLKMRYMILIYLRYLDAEAIEL